MQLVPVQKQALTRSEFERLADVPPEEEWLANLTHAKTRRAYKNDVREFIAHTGLHDYMELRSIVRAHIIDWRKDMERRNLEPATIRRKLSALSSLFDYLCERNAVAGNPPALGDRQARKLLEAPSADTLKGLRDRAILATLLYHGIRREELCGLKVKDLHSRQGVMHFCVHGKRAKIRFIPVNAAAQRTIEEYLARAGHRTDIDGPLFRPVKNNRTGRLDRHLDPASIYRNIVCKSESADRVLKERAMRRRQLKWLWRRLNQLARMIKHCSGRPTPCAPKAPRSANPARAVSSWDSAYRPCGRIRRRARFSCRCQNTSRIRPGCASQFPTPLRPRYRGSGDSARRDRRP